MMQGNDIGRGKERTREPEERERDARNKNEIKSRTKIEKNHGINIEQKLEKDLEEYDLILLVDSEDSSSVGGLMGKLINSRAFRNSEKKILVLPAEKYQDLILLYHTYEFSDRFKVIGRSSQYGGLFNYVDNGILTEQEAFELILR